MIDAACSGVEDPAEVFATSLRISGRLAWTHPEYAGFITGVGLDLLDAPRGLTPRALPRHPCRPSDRPLHDRRRLDRGPAPSPAGSSASSAFTHGTRNE